MIQNVLRSIGGVGVYGVVSICLFVSVFLGVAIWALFLKKPYLSDMSRLPLDGGEIEKPAQAKASPHSATES